MASNVGSTADELRPDAFYLRRDRAVVQDDVRRRHELLAAAHVARDAAPARERPRTP